jgi:hypothetical protein
MLRLNPPLPAAHQLPLPCKAEPAEAGGPIAKAEDLIAKGLLHIALGAKEPCEVFWRAPTPPVALLEEPDTDVLGTSELCTCTCDAEEGGPELEERGTCADHTTPC